MEGFSERCRPFDRKCRVPCCPLQQHLHRSALLIEPRPVSIENRSGNMHRKLKCPMHLTGAHVFTNGQPFTLSASISLLTTRRSKIRVHRVESHCLASLRPLPERTVRVLVAARLVAVSRSPTVDNDPPSEPRFCSVTWNFISARREPGEPDGSQETTRGPEETWRAATLHDHRSRDLDRNRDRSDEWNELPLLMMCHYARLLQQRDGFLVERAERTLCPLPPLFRECYSRPEKQIPMHAGVFHCHGTLSEVSRFSPRVFMLLLSPALVSLALDDLCPAVCGHFNNNFWPICLSCAPVVHHRRPRLFMPGTIARVW